MNQTTTTISETNLGIAQTHSQKSSKNQSSALEISGENSSEISPAIVLALKSTASLDTPKNSTHEPDPKSVSADFLHRQFLTLGKERHRLTHKLLALLPRIYKEKVYEAHGYATIYEYAGKLAGLSHSTVEKALKLDEKLKDKPHLQKAIETQGIHKVAIVANLATPENEKMFADKVENMSKPALQEYSKELRGKIQSKIQTTWQIELDQETMTLFLKLKRKLGKFGDRLSNKEALRRMLTIMEDKINETSKGKKEQIEARSKMMLENPKSQTQAKNSHDFLGETQERDGQVFSRKLCSNFEHHACEKFTRPNMLGRVNLATVFEKISCHPILAIKPKITRYIPVSKKRPALAQTNNKCAHRNCHRPAEILHHQTRFSESHSHDSIIPFCRIHHEFAHNGITEPLSEIDKLYRKYRQIALL